MQSGLTIKNETGNIQVVAVEFGQAEPYRISIGFWHRFQQTVMKTTLFITGNGKVSMFQRHLSVPAIYRK